MDFLFHACCKMYLRLLVDAGDISMSFTPQRFLLKSWKPMELNISIGHNFTLGLT